jgi:putative ABC transport system permease protein
MKLSDLNELAWQNLREAFLRNSLTTMGIAVGVASLVAMLSLGIGLQDMINRRLERGGLFDSVIVRQRMNVVRPGEQARNRLLGRAEAPDVPFTRLDADARRKLAALPNVVEVYPEYRFTGDMRLGDEGRLTDVASLPESSKTNDAFEGMLGHFFTSPEAHEIILQADTADSLAEIENKHAADMLGRTIVLRYPGRERLPATAGEPATADAGATAGRGGAATADEVALGFSVVSSEIQLQIVGIVKSDVVFSTPGTFSRSGAFLPLAVAEDLRVVQGNDTREVIGNSLASAGEQYASLTVRVERASAVPDVQEAARQMGFTTFSLLDFTQSMKRVFAILDLLLGIFGSLALAVASLGIVNTLVMAILERRREIGVLKALGASDRDVRQLFFAEASVMGLAGGAGGVAIGWGIGRIIQFVTAEYLQRQGIPAENIWLVPWWLVAGAMIFSLVVSLAAGMYPASRAAKLDPVEALRYQ